MYIWYSYDTNHLTTPYFIFLDLECNTMQTGCCCCCLLLHVYSMIIKNVSFCTVMGKIQWDRREDSVSIIFIKKRKKPDRKGKRKRKAKECRGCSFYKKKKDNNSFFLSTYRSIYQPIYLAEVGKYVPESSHLFLFQRWTRRRRTRNSSPTFHPLFNLLLQMTLPTHLTYLPTH